MAGNLIALLAEMTPAIMRKRALCLSAVLAGIVGLADWPHQASARASLPQPDTLVVGAVGDLMIGSWLTEILDREGPAYPFVEIEELLDRADILLANLEAPFLDDTTGVVPAEKTYTFAVPSRHVETLTAAGIDAVTLANNHILDFGMSGLRRTWEVLDGAAIVHVGTGIDSVSAHAHRIVEWQGRRVALLAYNHVFPAEFWAKEGRGGTAHASDGGLAREVRQAEAEADLVIVSFHWSAERLQTQKEYQQILARIAVDNGADLVIGHHPHVIQPLEWYRGRLIAYSLGNFVFASYSPTAGGALLLVRFEGERPVLADLYPLDVDNVRREFRPAPVTPEQWSQLGSAVVATLADSASAGGPGVSVDRAGYLRLISPE
jgi:poly-gamma-glutamate synthesis protein (capsule biosynthesis protein)